MKKPILPVILLLTLQLSAGQNAFNPGTGNSFMPKVNTVFYKLGDRIIQLKTFQYGDVKDIVYVNLHDDEMTAINGARKLLEKKGGFLIKIENYRTRNIKFRLDGKYYTIDPNRMFSRIGITQSLILFGNTSPKAIDEVEKFANRILQLIPQNPSYIIALHNNTNGRYSINSYLPGGAREKDARTIHVNPDQDADDFFLTTDSILFNQLAGEKYNMIWQDNEKAKKDGSLSVFCGERNIHYVNCETEHGRQPEYDEMIVAAESKIEAKNADAAMTAPNKMETKNPGVIPTATNKIETKNPGVTEASSKKIEEKKSDLVTTAANKLETKNTGITEAATKKIETKNPDVIPAPTNKTEMKNPVTAVTASNKIEAKNSGAVTATTDKMPARNAAITASKNNAEIISYSYQLIQASGHFPPKTNTEILFGEKKVGLIKSVIADTSRTIAGKIEMNKDFALYSNMDFFLFLSSNNPPRFEVRIDPTRKKELLNPRTAIVSIATRTVN